MARVIGRFLAGGGTLILPFVILIGSLFLLPSSKVDFASVDGAQPIRSLAWSADGQWIAAGGDNAEIWIYDAETKKQISMLGKGQGTINSLAFDPQTGWLAAGVDDGNIYVWDLTTNKPITLSGHSAAIRRVLWADEDSRLGSEADDGQVIIWDVDRGAQTSTFNRFDKGLAAALASSTPDVETVSLDALPSKEGCSHYQTALNNAAAQQRILANYAAPVNAAVLSADNQWLAVARSDAAEINVWNASTGALVSTTTCTQATSLAWAPAAERVAIGAANGDILIWEPGFSYDYTPIFALALTLSALSAVGCYLIYRLLEVKPNQARIWRPYQAKL